MNRRALLGVAVVASGAFALWWFLLRKQPSLPLAMPAPRAAPPTPAGPSTVAQRNLALAAAGLSLVAGGVQNMLASGKPLVATEPDSNGFRHEVYKGWTIRSALGFVGTTSGVKLSAYRPDTDGSVDELVVRGDGPATPEQFADALRRVKARIDADPVKGRP